MDRCVKDVKIDHEAQFDFLLKRVSAMYLQRFGGGAQDSKTKDKQSSGPLQLSIPLLGAPIASPMEAQQPPRKQEEETNEPPKETVTVYEVKNETTTSEAGDETTVFLGNTGGPFTDKNYPSHNDASKSDGIVPVAEFVDETNGTSFSEVVDYKIPIDLKAILNVSNAKRSNGSEIDEGDEEEDSMTKEMNGTSVSPTLVFVLTPTKRPQAESSSSSSSSSTLFEDNSSNSNATAHVIVRMTETGNNSTPKQEIVGVSVPDSMIPPLRKLSEIPLLVDDRTESNGSVLEASGIRVDDGEVQESTYEDEEVEEEVEEEDEYVDNTDPPEEEFTDLEGEILKHGEAGITIPVKNLDRLHLDEHHREGEERPEETDNSDKKDNDTFDASRDEIAIRFNHSTTSNVDETESNISSEATIKDDVIVETTLLNVNPVKASSVVKSSAANDSAENNEEERFESEKVSDVRSKVVFPSEEIRTTTSTSTEEKKKVDNDDDDQVGRTRSKEKGKNPTDLKNVELLAEPSSSESLLYDPRPGDRYPDDSIAEIHTMEEESSRTTNSPNSRAGSLLDLEGSPSYVRSAQSYVKFPSDEINSIHNQDYKERGQHLYDEGLYASSTSTKSTVPVVHQKSSYSRTPSGWRIDRQQQPDRERHRSVVVQRQKPRPPVYFEFRTKTPLMRVPSFFSIGQPSRSASIVDRGYRNAYVQVSPFRRVGY
ncbi:hypothetical protein KPH14_003294 [Odynerus spinipes]|uniref:Uncharacterized protein n=1 Tax=Odynerus spinipes TaxID=1348599 RepID=A0AAD9RCE9_9HYME|nr:hypothetical protein KPH14_003294 [Odynerus spinipes]